MINFVKTISSRIKDARRLIKVLRYGLSDIQEINVVAPFGTDAAPVQGWIAIYAKTEEKGKNVILGFINENQIAKAGEHRIFSTDSEGNVVFSIHLKNDGTADIGGSDDNMVRFSSLNSGLSNQDGQINTELAKIAVAITGLGGTYTPGTINTNISAAKIDEIKTL